MVTKLSSVAAEYLRNHDDLEAARTLFLGERARLLAELGTIAVEATSTIHPAVLARTSDEVDGWYNITVSARYTARRLEAGHKRESGYSVGLGSYLEHAGAQTLLWFKLKLNGARKAALLLPELEKHLGGVQVLPSGPWLYLRTSSQPSSDLDLHALTAEVARLPDLFKQADDWITNRWME